MQILRRLPFGETPSAVDVAGETVPVRAYQIILWVSLATGETLAPAKGRLIPWQRKNSNECFGRQRPRSERVTLRFGRG